MPKRKTVEMLIISMLNHLWEKILLTQYISQQFSTFLTATSGDNKDYGMIYIELLVRRAGIDIALRIHSP